ncbi:MAG: hypothetical protein HY817_05085 [Candidatus Abawacabacteria bacterium]|nr:hypothetical protein [Candidatus Abawacabacteria bacterium]
MQANGSTGLTKYLLYDRLAEGPDPRIPRVAGLVPFVVARDNEDLWQDSLRLVLREVLGEKMDPVSVDAMMDDEDTIKKAEADLRGALRAEYARVIDGAISIEKMQTAYDDIVKEIITEALDENKHRIDRGDKPLFTPGIVQALTEGKVIATEDLVELIGLDEDAFLTAVSGLSDAQLKKPLLRKQYLNRAIKSFQSRFDKAELALLDKLGLREPGEIDDILIKRMQDRLSDAVKFLEMIHKVAHGYQLKKTTNKVPIEPGEVSAAKSQILMCPLPEDLAQKRFFDLAETLFYSRPNYAVGKQRRFLAQQVLVLALLYNKINQYPPFRARRELARRMNNLVNYTLDPAVGREGVDLGGVFVSSQDEWSTEATADNFILKGMKKMRLLPLYIYNPVTNEEELLFPEGIEVMLKERTKGADSTVLKLLNKGQIEKIHDLVAYEVVIDDRELSRDQFVDRVRKLKLYFKEVWGVYKFYEDDTAITKDTPTGVSGHNPVKANDFEVEKVVFFKEIEDAQGRKVMVPVEVQFKSLKMKLMGDSGTGPTAHKEYEFRRTVEHALFAQLYPGEVFNEFAQIASEVGTKIGSEVRAADRQEL